MAEIKEGNVKCRATNQWQTETTLLAELCVRYGVVIENKKTDAFSAKEKEAAWISLASEFQACGGDRRDWLQLKHVRTLKLAACCSNYSINLVLTIVLISHQAFCCHNFFLYHWCHDLSLGLL